MARRDLHQKEMFLSDSPGDAEKVRIILAQWGVEESSIRRLMREHPPEPSDSSRTKGDARKLRPRKYADA